MQRLVAVGLGPRNVVVKLVVDGLKLAVQPTQGGIAGWHIGHDDAQRANVIQLLKCERFAAHLFHNAVDVLWAALHGSGNALRRECYMHPLLQLPYRCFSIHAFGIQ